MIAGGALLVPPRGAWRVAGAVLGLLGGIGFTVAPIVHGQLAQAPSRFLDMFGALGYHYGTGVVITALGAFALGRVSGTRERSVGAPPSRVGTPG